jgi:CRISPR-associated endonuclease/helicase Cas3
VPQQVPLSAAARLEDLLAYIRALPETASERVKAARQSVLENCLTAAEWPEKILSLSVPTGGGKTLAAMAFALRRAALAPECYRRVIVVIPYLSIIEQNAAVYEQVFGVGAVLEHHSAAFTRVREHSGRFIPMDGNDEGYQNPVHRIEAENWDAPLIVTTSVRFFESLFSNSPGDLRRVHNIARSIIILDEVQVLPVGLLAPLLSMMGELESKWGCTFVLSTATQPAFEKPASAGPSDPRWAPGRVREIVQSPAELHRSLRRVVIEWRIQSPVGWQEVASWMRQERQALCVVNLKKHALELYEELSGPAEGRSDPAFFHLSTVMCPAHRLRKIQTIRQRLREGLPCRVVSTQLIEAGVDLDFPVAFRALGPLDSIMQVAGRADREGTLTERAGSPAGRLIVFKPIDHRTPPNEYERATGITEIAARSAHIEVDDLDAMSNFFGRMYGEGADLGAKYLGYRSEGRFAKLAEEFELISSRTRNVFVPFQEGKSLILELKRVKVLTRDLRRRLQRYTIGLHPWEFTRARGVAIAEVSADSELWYAVDTAYEDNIGLRLSFQPEQLVW